LLEIGGLLQAVETLLQQYDLVFRGVLTMLLQKG